MHDAAMPNRIAVIGAGFCGSVLAARLLRRSPPGVDEILLVERSAAMGRGLAYAARDFPYLLNVPAGRLSATPEDPLQFLRFARLTLPDTDAEDFLPRRLYGDYLEECLNQAERAAGTGSQLVRMHAEVTRLSSPDGSAGPLALHMDGRAPITAQQVVLALGNPPPRALPGAEQLRAHPAVFEDPFRAPQGLRPEQTALIVGNGLTMADVVSYLSRDATRTPRLMTLSRRGLMPLPQSTFHSHAVRGGADFFANMTSVREVMAASRSLAQEVVQLGGDWREVVTFVRHWAPALWQRFGERERRRFLRHVQGVWDVHRHRLPLPIAAHLDELRRSGILSVGAGRILAMESHGQQLRVTWRPRGGATSQSTLIDAVINATGPDYSLSESRSGLLRALRDDGLISADPLNLGLRTTASGACIGADGRPNERLFYLGPMLRAGHWEATAVAELRLHAEGLASHLAAL
jgi:uncharacterized NAD(P)/FAD-binding protein YdhS